jgi:hypothetical protein
MYDMCHTGARRRTAAHGPQTRRTIEKPRRQAGPQHANRGATAKAAGIRRETARTCGLQDGFALGQQPAKFFIQILPKLI